MIFFVPLAMPLNQLFEVMFDSSVVVKYPIFWTQKAKNRCACWNPCAWRTFWLFWMKVQNPGRMFEIVERNFNVRRKHGVDYNVWCNAAPLILADLSIFLLISRMKFISGKIATNISICAFGIYLVHIMSWWKKSGRG